MQYMQHPPRTKSTVIYLTCVRAANTWAASLCRRSWTSCAFVIRHLSGGPNTYGSNS